MGVLKFSSEVKNAKLRNMPIVALESTIITHGMPYPENLNTARLVEQAVRDGEAVPATVAIIDGVINVGMSDEQLKYFSINKSVMKLSRADLSVCLSEKMMK